MKTEERLLAVKLTEQEWDERADELAAISIEIDRVADRKKAVTQEIKTEDEQLQSRRKLLAHTVHTRIESRYVLCQWYMNYDRQMAYLTRMDTGEAVEQRAMTNEELQTRLAI
jgi:hypothetical protein